MLKINGFSWRLLLQRGWVSLGCAAGAQASPPVSTLVPAGGFPCWLCADMPFLVEGLFL